MQTLESFYFFVYKVTDLLFFSTVYHESHLTFSIFDISDAFIFGILIVIFYVSFLHLT